MSDDEDFVWIDDPGGLERVIQAAQEADWIALDTESNSMFVYRERICLVQLNAGGSTFVIDPLAPGLSASALRGLRASLERPEQTVLLHGGEYDVAVLKRELDIDLRGVFDTQQAASLLGWPRTGYGAVVEAICQVSLGKKYARYDWGTRPVDSGALRYAADDVIYLPRVAQALRREIERADLVEELAIANQTVMDAAPHDTSFRDENVYRVKKLRQLDEAQQRRLLAVFRWRDALARELDVPAGRLLNDRAMIGLIQADPRSRRELVRLRLGGRVNRRAQDLLAVLEGARQDPPTLPRRASNPPPSREQKLRNERLRNWRREEAERRGVPLQVVLPATALDALATEGAEDLEAVPQLGAKRIELYGQQLRKLCAPAR